MSMNLSSDYLESLCVCVISVHTDKWNPAAGLAAGEHSYLAAVGEVGFQS